MRAVGVLFSWALLSQLAGPVLASALRSDAPDLAGRLRGVAPGATVRLESLVLDGAEISVDLTRFRVFAPDARVVVDAGAAELALPDNAYFEGHVAGRPDARVLLSALERGVVRGLVLRPDGVFLLGQRGEAAAAPLASRRVDPEADLRRPGGFTCQALHAGPPLAPGVAARTPASGVARRHAPDALPGYTARVAVETDYEFFQLFGNATLAVDYVGDVFAYASRVYRAEANTTLLVQYVSLWTTAADPWGQFTPLCGLFEFGSYWNLNRTGVQRTLAHFLSGKSNGGGVSWIPGLCAGAFTYANSCTPALAQPVGGDYSYSGDVDGTFNLGSPGIVWDIYVVAHEIGHNFNSPHTHCYAGLGGNPNPVDACYALEPGCYAATPALPGLGALAGGVPGAGNGTLMSYCHQIAPGLSNISLTLGLTHPFGVAAARVPARMSAYAGTVAGGVPACVAYTPARKGDFDMNGTTDLVLRNVATNDNVLWLLSGVALAQAGLVSPSPPDANWRVVGADDFNDDLRTDLVLWNQATGAVEFWMMKPGTTRWGPAVALTGAAPLPLNWRVAATGDFDFDTRPDLLWRNTSSQKLVIWTLNGTAKTGAISPTPDQAVDGNWQVVAALDYNADGNRDLLWYNTTSGKIVMWFMDASVTRTAGRFTSPANAGDANWKVVAGGDYGVGSGGVAGSNDIVWRNDTSGNLVVWYMDNAGNRTWGEFFSPPAPTPAVGFEVVGPK